MKRTSDGTSASSTRRVRKRTWRFPILDTGNLPVAEGDPPDNLVELYGEDAGAIVQENWCEIFKQQRASQ